MLQDDIWLADHEIFSQDWSCLLEVDAVELMVVEGRLEAAKALEDREELLGRVAVLDSRVLSFEHRGGPQSRSRGL